PDPMLPGNGPPARRISAFRSGRRCNACRTSCASVRFAAQWKAMKRFLLLLLAVFAGTVSAEGLRIGVVLPFSSPEGAALQQLLTGLQRTIRLQASPALRDLTFIERDDRGSPERSAA